MNDLKFAVRSLLRRPAWSVVAVVVLALGLGATTAIFSVVYEVALRPLPWPDADRIVQVGQHPADEPGQFLPGYSLGLLEPWMESTEAIEFVAAIWPGRMVLTGFDEAMSLEAARVGPDFFRVLGRGPLLGRGFDADGDGALREDLVVLSHGLATRLFGEAERAVGALLELDGVQHEVVGVTAPDFAYPDEQTVLWRPLLWRASTDPNERQHVHLPVIARLLDDASLERARQEARAILAEEARPRRDGTPANVGGVRTFHEVRRSRLSGAITALALAVGLVLLIACANTANLLLARGVTRLRELATRSALGAGRSGIARLVLMESVLLALVGCALGILLAAGALLVVRRVQPGDLPGLESVSLHLPVLGFALGAALLCALAFGALPAFVGSTVAPARVLGRSGGPVWRGRSALARLRSVLAIGEVALALALLVGAGLLIGSFTRLARVDPGFAAEGVLTFELSPAPSRFPTAESRFELVESVVEGLRAEPSVEAAGAVNFLPLHRGRIVLSFEIEGRPPVEDAAAEPEGDLRLASPGYFRALGIPVVSGRAIEATDRADAPRVLVVNEALAERYFPGEDAVGQRTSFGEIVGVVGNVRSQGLDSEPLPTFYLPFPQMESRFAMLIMRRVAFLVRAGDPTAVLPAVRTRLAAIDPALPMENVRLLEEMMSASVAEPRFYATTLGLFSAVALLIAALGVYGVLSFAAQQRIHETGIRLALGAERRDVVARMVREGVVLASIGAALGAVTAWWTSRSLSALLHDIEPRNGSVLALAAALLLGSALVASWLPARRAARVDPVVALRQE